MPAMGGAQRNGLSVPAGLACRAHGCACSHQRTQHRLRGSCGFKGWDGGLTNDQAAAVDQVCNSGDAVSLLVDPAGTGKTTTMRAAAACWAAARLHRLG